MKIGIDFGTSYSAAAARIGDELVHIRFDGQPQFRTAVYFPTTLPDLDAFELDAAMEAEVDAIARSLRNEQSRAGTPPRPSALLRRDAIRVVRRRWLEARMRDAAASAADLQHAVFGEAAIESYLLEGSGNLVQSPKSMLGFNLHPRAKETITGIAAHILEHIRLTASQQLGTTVRAATLGRPVRFRSSLGEAGGEQALALLREAATQAGFDAIEFLEEPAAAALHYHAASPARHTTLVVDIGGGTTDIALAEIGGGEAPRVHRAWGVANGGTDVDLALSMAQVMPLFGKGASRIPVHHFVEAATVQDMPRQREFHNRDFRHVDAPFGARLQGLQRDGGTTRLYRGVEGMKVRLSGHDTAGHALDYIEPGLRVDASRADLEAASARFLATIGGLLDEVRGELDAPPDSLFLTGGMSGAPYVQAAAQARFPDARIVRGDPSLGVVSGLAEHART
ncbi:heat-shock protein Hsp70 [Luteimonas chenhongjianii]|uniref:Heat-shock protein Hsp70 n=1 Tax=Luteimonas chenhongjianii TaxID=2006110 RepID=A0A290XDK7_9GAMM|nr:Hsp70 family protein [Luteimonas chenhongjianii]ATD67244.1 heat-shock protein Hsp70 [Luteimonas chenhongjianii]